MFRPRVKRNRTEDDLKFLMSDDVKMDDIIVAPAAKRFKRLARRSRPLFKKGGRKSRDQINRMIHSFVEQYRITQWTSASGPGIGMNFALSNVGDFANYRTLFEQYRLVRIRVICSQTQTEAPVQAAAQYMPTLWVAVDPNDATAPASFDEVLQTGRAKPFQIFKPTVIADFVPTALFEVSDGGGGTTTSTQQKRWYSLENVALQHYGLKIWMDPVPTGNTGITVVGEYYFDMKTGK